MQLDDRVIIATPEGVEIDLVLAGLGSRFLARLLDTVIQGAAIFVLVIVVVAAAANSELGDVNGWVLAAVSALVFVVVFLYDVAFEILGSGRTPGKRAAGIRVVELAGEPVGFLASAVRNILRLVDFLPAFYLVGTVAILASSRDQRLGDMAGGTLVVRERFGGPGAAVPSGAVTTVPSAAVAAWDVTAVAPVELLAVRTFLDRRLAIPYNARWFLAVDLATRIAPKVVGIPPGLHPEYVLEGVAVAKGARGA